MFEHPHFGAFTYSFLCSFDSGLTLNHVPAPAQSVNEMIKLFALRVTRRGDLEAGDFEINEN